VVYCNCSGDGGGGDSSLGCALSGESWGVGGDEVLVNLRVEPLLSRTGFPSASRV
jgi:hypothetical protein